MSDDTIAAVATPLGEGGIGVVRLSGAAAFPVARRVFRPSAPLDWNDLPARTVHPGRVFDADGPVDEALLTVFRAPKSYTGEDVAEISCHGSSLLVTRLLRLCLAAGARHAEPGEFTRRAFLNGKMDLAQAEAVSALIAARSEKFRRLALDQLEGGLSRHLDALRRDLVDLLAHVEASLDFADEEVPVLPAKALAARIDGLLSRLREMLATAPRGRLLRDGLRAVLVGKPNVGKSSLFNALLRSDRAIVTDVPGTTRDALEERLLVREVPVVLTDTAGLRRGAGRVEGEGARRARRALNAADVALFVTDISRPVTDEDRDVAALLAEKRSVLVLNKCDAVGVSRGPGSSDGPARAAQAAAALLPRSPSVRTSAVSGEGIDALRDAVVACHSAGEGPDDAGSAPTVIQARHEALLREAADALAAARATLKDPVLRTGATPSGDGNAVASEECLSVDLRQALARLDEITGRGVHDDVLNAVFAQFCIGK